MFLSAMCYDVCVHVDDDDDDVGTQKRWIIKSINNWKLYMYLCRVWTALRSYFCKNNFNKHMQSISQTL